MPDPKIIEGTARRRPPLSKPLAWAYVAIGLALLGWLYWTRTATPLEFVSIAFVSICLGGVLAAIFRDVD